MESDNINSVNGKNYKNGKKNVNPPEQRQKGSRKQWKKKKQYSAGGGKPSSEPSDATNVKVYGSAPENVRPDPKEHIGEKGRAGAKKHRGSKRQDANNGGKSNNNGNGKADAGKVKTTPDTYQSKKSSSGDVTHNGKPERNDIVGSGRNKGTSRSGGKNGSGRRVSGGGRGRRPAVHDNFDEIRTHGGDYVRYDYDDRDEVYSPEDEAESYITAAYADNNQKRRSGGAVRGAVAGRNAVRELIRSGRSIDKIFVRSGEREGSIIVIVAEAAGRGIPIVEVSSEKLDAMAGGSWHQGVVAMAAEKQYTDIDGILAVAKERDETPLVVIADGIEDPQNLGALIRCAECAGAHGVIIPKRRAAGLTPAVTKASAGAVEHMAVAKVQNIAEAVEKLKKAGLWIFAAEAGGTPYYETDFKVPAAIVMGGEDSGVSRLVRDKSDFTVSIPMWGHVNSLNVSAAAAVILTHAARMQRS